LHAYRSIVLRAPEPIGLHNFRYFRLNTKGVAIKTSFTTTVLFLLLTGPAWAGFSEGSIAYERGDYATALKEWQSLAGQGHVSAQQNLAIMYRQGRGIEQNYGEAMKWYRRAAEQGNAKAQFSLGLMYYEAEGVRQDYAKAAKWYRKAAKQGISLAQFNLGSMYFAGTGVRQNYAEAYKWWGMRSQRKTSK
jgi:TPR repeat protein